MTVRTWHKDGDAEQAIRTKLRSYRSLVTKLDACKALYDTLYPSSTGWLTDEPRGHSDDLTKTERIVQQRLELSGQMAQSLNQMRYEIGEIMTLINRLPADESTVIMRRYTMAESWEEIGREINYCEKQVRRIHGRAVRRLAESSKTKDVQLCP